MVILVTLDSDFVATVLKDLQFSSEHIVQFSSELLLFVLVYLHEIRDFA